MQLSKAAAAFMIRVLTFMGLTAVGSLASVYLPGQEGWWVYKVVG